MDGTIPPISETARPQRKKRFGMVVYIVLFFILTAVVIGIGIRLTSFLGDSQEEDDDGEITIVTLSPTDMLLPTETPAPSPTEVVKPTTKPTATPTPKKAADITDSESGLDRSKLSVSVLNGSGVSGAASKMSTFLKDLGYEIASVGNADNFDYQKIRILIKSDKSKFLSLLKKDIEESYVVGLASEDLDASSSADAHVIIGSE